MYDWIDQRLLNLPGWTLIGAFPDHEPEDVGSWLLTHGNEAMLLEIPEGLTVRDVRSALKSTGTQLKYATASHHHEDHFDKTVWEQLKKEFYSTLYINPHKHSRNYVLEIGGELVYIIQAPKHSVTDRVTVFRGVAMTGDIELGTLQSVNSEVPKYVKRWSMDKLAKFQEKYDYNVHTVFSAHLNDVRTNVDWPSLFRY